MAYIGRDIQYGVLDKQSFTADSSTTAFTLDSGVKNAMSLLVCVGGVVQEPEVAYTASGTTLTFTSAPTTGDIVYAVYLGKELAASTGGRESITFQTGTGDGSNTTPITLSTAPANAQSLMVMLNGVTQVPVTDYTVSGTTLTFTTAPDSGMGILVYHLGKAAAIGTLADNSVTNPKIVTMDAAKLTGTLPSGMGVDSTSIDQTIASLGIHVAVADNKASFNLPGVFIDQFESDSGILTETDVDRNTTGEYVGSMSGTSGADAGGTSGSWTNSNTSHNIATTPTYGTGDDLGMNGASYNYNYISHSSGTETTTGEAMLVGDCRSSFTGVSATIAETTTGGNSEYYEFGLMTSVTFATTTNLTGMNSDGIYIAFGGNGKTIHIVKKTGLAETLLSSYTESWTSSQEISLARSGSTMYLQIDGVTVYTVGSSDFNSSAALKAVYAFGRGATARAFNDCAYRYNATALKGIVSGSDSATGTLISTASTAPSATTEASGVMVYENSSGTATLGTDLKAYFSADNGSNWTEASSYGTPINFNGASKKLVKLGKTTGLTSGTQMKLKAEWANQVASIPASGSAKTLTATGQVQHSTTQEKIGSSSILFDGSGDKLQTPSSNDWAFGSSNDFTIETWVYRSALGANKTLIGNRNGGGQTYFMFYLGASNNLTFSSGGSILADTSSNIMPAGSWIHVAATRDNGTLRIYKDGVQVTSSANTTNFSSNIPVYIGSGDSQGNGDFSGYMDEIRISSNCRYPSGTTFTPSTTAFTSDANTVLLIHSDTTNTSTTFIDSSPVAGVTGKETRLHGWAVNY